MTARDLAGIDERFVRSLSLLRLHGLESSWASLGLTGSASIVGCNAFLSSSPLSPTSLSSSSPATLRSTAGGMAAGGHARGVGGRVNLTSRRVVAVGVKQEQAREQEWEQEHLSFGLCGLPRGRL